MSHNLITVQRETPLAEIGRKSVRSSVYEYLAHAFINEEHDDNDDIPKGSFLDELLKRRWKRGRFTGHQGLDEKSEGGALMERMAWPLN